MTDDHRDSPPALHIRLGTPHDVAVLQQFEAPAGVYAHRRFSIEAWISAGQCWVAAVNDHAVNDHIVAYGVLNYGFYDRGFIAMLYVAPPERRRGVGAAVVNHLTHACRTPEIFTSTNQSNLPMKRMLERLGFVPSGTIENLDPGDLELVYFKRIVTT